MTRAALFGLALLGACANKASRAGAAATKAHQWQPVECDDGTPAWVRQADTRRHAIVLPTPDGPILEQIQPA